MCASKLFHNFMHFMHTDYCWTVLQNTNKEQHQLYRVQSSAKPICNAVFIYIIVLCFCFVSLL